MDRQSDKLKRPFVLSRNGKSRTKPPSPFARFACQHLKAMCRFKGHDGLKPAPVSLPCHVLQIVWLADNRGLGGGSLAKRPLYCRQMRCEQEPTTGGAKFVLYGSFRQVFMDQEECASLKAKEAHLANVLSVTGVM